MPPDAPRAAPRAGIPRPRTSSRSTASRRRTRRRTCPPWRSPAPGPWRGVALPPRRGRARPAWQCPGRQRRPVLPRPAALSGRGPSGPPLTGPRGAAPRDRRDAPSRPRTRERSPLPAAAPEQGRRGAGARAGARAASPRGPGSDGAPPGAPPRRRSLGPRRRGHRLRQRPGRPAPRDGERRQSAAPHGRGDRPSPPGSRG